MVHALRLAIGTLQAIVAAAFPTNNTHSGTMQHIDAKPQQWDCHVHVLEPDLFPYRYNRTYTPEAASLPGLVNSTAATAIVIVQASVENGTEPLLYHLNAGNQQFPNHIWRGSVLATTEPGSDLASMPIDEVNALHAAGVRSVRLQSNFGSFKSDQDMHDYILRLAQSYCVAELGWSISITQALQAWSNLTKFVESHESVQNVRFVAEHIAYANPPDFGTPEFEALLDFLRSGRLWMKISALHRRSPGNIYAMEDIVKQVVSTAPDKMVFGSDWPHTNPAAVGLEPSAPLVGVNTTAEMEAIKTWVGDENWFKMLRVNPARLFG